MSRILAIFRKDARHLWPHIAVFFVLMLLGALLDPTYTRTGSADYSLFSSLLPLACWSLLVALIHEEKLPGDRQYWLTRPISWKELLAAKALFIAAFINLPLLICHLAVWSAVGVPALAHLPALLWKQVFFTAFYILPVAALAAITRNLGQVILTALIILLPTALFAGFLVERFRGSWGGREWLMMAGMAAVLYCGIAGVLLVEYSRRRTTLARILVGAVALMIVAVFYSPVARSSNSGVQLSLDPRSAPPQRPHSNGWNMVGLEIPVRLDGLTSDAQLLKNSLTFEIDSSSGTWRPRIAEGGLHDGWLNIQVSKPIFLAMQSRPVDLSGALEYTVFGEPQTLPPPGDRPTPVPRIGACSRAVDPSGAMSIICYSPFPHASLYLGTPGGGANWIVPMGYVGASVPTAAGFQPLTRFSTQLPFTAIGEARLVAGRPLARLDIRFEFRAIRLADFASSTSR
jgi:hypothetical protein